MKLTRRESEILSYVALSIELLGHAPTQREIARRLGVTANAVKDRVLRARWRLAIPRGTPTAEARREVRARL